MSRRLTIALIVRLDAFTRKRVVDRRSPIRVVVARCHPRIAEAIHIVAAEVFVLRARSVDIESFRDFRARLHSFCASPTRKFLGVGVAHRVFVDLKCVIKPTGKNLRQWLLVAR